MQFKKLAQKRYMYFLLLNIVLFWTAFCCSGELEEKLLPVSSAADITGKWEMYYQEIGGGFSEDNAFFFPYHRFDFLPDGYVKIIGSSQPFDELSMTVWSAAHKTIKYEVAKPGLLIIKDSAGQYPVVISLVADDLRAPISDDAPILKKGDLVMSYLNRNKQVYLRRYLRRM